MAARLVTTVVVAIALGGCAMKGDIRDLQTEMRALAARQDSLVAQLRADALSTQDTLRTQGDQMFEFRGDINQSLRSIMEGLTRIEALAGENQRGMIALRDQMANLRRAPATPPPIVAQDSAADASGTSEQLISGGGGNPDQLWGDAMRQYDRESLNAATMAFAQFLQEYPAHARAAQAHFYLADILAQQDRPEDAIDAFLEVQELFPTSEQVPAAMYRIGSLQRQLGDEDAAKATLERLMNTYPDSGIAMLARDLLKEIGQ